MRRGFRGFTLVEVLIVVVLLGTLMGLLFRTYITISQISVKVENEKAVQNEMLFLMQTLENLTENYSIDYSRYNQTLPLTGTNGFSNVLYLSGEGGAVQLSVFATGNCLNSPVTDDTWFANNKDQYLCWLQLNRNGEIIDLLDPSKVIVTSSFFRILPVVDAQNLYEALDQKSIGYGDLRHPSVQLNMQLYHRRFVLDWPYRISVSFETFFNM